MPSTIDDARIAAQRLAAEAARRRAEAEARRAAEQTAKKNKVTARRDELSAGKGGALRRAAAARLPSATTASSVAPTGLAPTFKVNAFGAPTTRPLTQTLVAPVPGDGPPIDLNVLTSNPQAQKGLDDAKKVDAAATQGGLDAGVDTLKQLLAANSDPIYQQFLVGQAASTLPKLALQDPATAPRKVRALLDAVPPDERATVLNQALTHTNDADLQQSIVSSSVDALKSSFQDPEKYGELINQFDPSVQKEVVAQTQSAALANVQSLASSDPVKAAQLLEQYVNQVPEADREAFVTAAQPAITAITDKLNHDLKDQPPGADNPVVDEAQKTLTSLKNVANASGPNGPKLVADAMAPSISAGTLSDNGTLGPSPLRAALCGVFQDDREGTLPLVGALRDSLQAKGSQDAAYQLDQVLKPEAAQALSDARDHYDGAKGKVDELNSDLQAELKTLGPSLNDAQRQQYTEKFREKHKDEYQALDAAEKRLGDTLKAAGPGILNNPDPAIAKLALESAQKISKTPSGAAGALAFIQLVDANPQSILATQLQQASGGKLDDKLVEIRDNCIPNLYAKDMSEMGGDGAEAAAMLKEQLESLETSKKLGANFDSIRKGISALSKGDFKALSEISSTGPLQRAFQGAGVVLGLAKLGQDPNDVGATEYFRTLAATGAEGADVLALGLNTVNRVLTSGAAGDAAKFLEDVAPGLRTAAAVLGGVGAFQDYLKSGNAGDLVNAIGGLISTVGAASEAGLILDSTGVGLPVGVAVQVVGALVSLIGGVISGNETSDRRHDDERDVLKRIGLDDPTANALGTADRGSLEALGKLGLSADQIQQLAKTHSDVFTNPDARKGFIELAQTMRLKPQDLQGFLDAASSDKDFTQKLAGAYQRLHSMSSPSQNTTWGAYRQLLEGNDGAKKFVQANAPWNFDSSIQDADGEYQATDGSAFKLEQLGLDMSRHSTTYRVELLRRMDQDHWLTQDTVQQMAQYGKPSDIRAALDAAHDQGAISDATYNDALKGLSS